MNDVNDFVALVRDEVGLPVTVEHLIVGFDQVPEWDSLYLLRLATILEREIGRPLPLADLLDAGSLGSVYRLAVAR
jgi:hypothetical protein